LKAPDVAVQVTEYRPFFILGEVKNPGSYAYVPNMTGPDGRGDSRWIHFPRR